ncbi:MAG: hypothetical protein IJ688_07770 [Treponema sp.]|nr:hypothetical protein [Treponema sp.]
MGDDNEVKIHQEVLMFLGNELERIHQNSQNQSYNIETEYEKTKKNHSIFSIILLVSSLLVILGVAFIMTKVISSRNQEIEVSLDEFEDLNLKNLLSSVSAAQSNYESALKVVACTDADYESALKDAEASRQNDIFVLDSLHLDSQKEYTGRLELIQQRYIERVSALKDEYAEKRKEAEEDAELFRLALEKFDASTIENAREANSLDSESQLHKLEMKSMEDKYEKRIAELEKTIRDQRERNQEEMRLAVNRVVEKYQAEIDRLDPKLSDKKAIDIISYERENRMNDFNGPASLEENEIFEEQLVNAVSGYQEKYNQFKYLDETVASIPQKYSIPEYVDAARNLVNSMSDYYLDSALSFYQEKNELNARIDEGLKEIARRQKEYEVILSNMLASVKAPAALLSASDYDDIFVYLMPEERAKVTEEGLAAEFKADKLTVKGLIFASAADEITGMPKFRFKVAEDKDRNLPEIDFSQVFPGLTVKITAK